MIIDIAVRLAQERDLAAAGAGGPAVAIEQTSRRFRGNACHTVVTDR